MNSKGLLLPKNMSQEEFKAAGFFFFFSQHKDMDIIKNQRPVTHLKETNKTVMEAPEKSRSLKWLRKNSEQESCKCSMNSQNRGSNIEWQQAKGRRWQQTRGSQATDTELYPRFAPAEDQQTEIWSGWSCLDTEQEGWGNSTGTAGLSQETNLPYDRSSPGTLWR